MLPFLPLSGNPYPGLIFLALDDARASVLQISQIFIDRNHRFSQDSEWFCMIFRSFLCSRRLTSSPSQLSLFYSKNIDFWDFWNFWNFWPVEALDDAGLSSTFSSDFFFLGGGHCSLLVRLHWSKSLINIGLWVLNKESQVLVSEAYLEFDSSLSGLINAKSRIVVHIQSLRNLCFPHCKNTGVFFLGAAFFLAFFFGAFGAALKLGLRWMEKSKNFNLFNYYIFEKCEAPTIGNEGYARGYAGVEARNPCTGHLIEGFRSPLWLLQNQRREICLQSLIYYTTKLER